MLLSEEHSLEECSGNTVKGGGGGSWQQEEWVEEGEKVFYPGFTTLFPAQGFATGKHFI